MSNYGERFQDIAVTHLDIEGFDQLTEQQKKLAFYLSQAGMWGRYISTNQGSKHNIPLFENLIKLYENTTPNTPIHNEVHDTLFMMFAHNGIYHWTTGEKLHLPLTHETLLTVKAEYPEAVEAIENNWFKANIKQWRTVQKDDGVTDIVTTSGGNLYENLTAQEVRDFREKNKIGMSEEELKAPNGFNERLYKDEDGNIHRQIISVNGLYAPYVAKIIENLSIALEFTENEQQHKSISTLINFYKTGSAVDFDKHCVEWVQDKNSTIYFINGLIESYDDPLGVVSTFESIVGFKSKSETEKVQKIVENIQWFEDNSPIPSEFKKEEAKGLSGSYVKVISMAGDTAPVLPLGINLPNSAWIRQEFGSKSVNLENSASSRSGFDSKLREAIYQADVLPLLEKYSFKMNNLHTDLHEIAGHGSGKELPGVNKESLDSFYSTIEEARADLVALYYCADPKLKEFGIYEQDFNVEEAAKALYTSYITNGAFAQLRRVSGEELTQAHFRNRQLISNWILEKGDSEKVVMLKENGLTYVKVNDVQHVRDLCGELLKQVQTIKSTGDLEGAKDLVMNYGTKINQELLKEAHERFNNLGMPNLVAFTTPQMEWDENSQIQIKQVDNFVAQQIELFKTNCQLAPKNKLKM